MNIATKINLTNAHCARAKLLIGKKASKSSSMNGVSTKSPRHCDARAIGNTARSSSRKTQTRTVNDAKKRIRQSENNAQSRVISTRASAQNDIVTVNDQSFDREVLQSEIPVLIDFWATWCGPCKLISKVVEKAAPEFRGKLKIVKIETDPNPILVEKYEVYGLPTLMMFKNGSPVLGSKREGAINLQKLKDYLSTHGVEQA